MLASSAWLSTGLSFQETRPVLEGELPDSDPLVRDTRAFEDANPDRNYYAVGIEAPGPEGIWNPGTLAKIVSISEEAASLPGSLPNVQSLATWDHVVAQGDVVEVRKLMPDAPHAAAEIAALEKLVSTDPLLVGRLVSADGAMAMIRVGYASDVPEETVHDGLEGLRQRFQGPERIAIFGVDHLNEEIDLAMSRHLTLLLPVAIALLLALFWVCFGRLQAVWVPASLVLLTVVDFVGLMGVLRIPRSVLSSVIPLLLVVVLGSYAVHLLRRVYEEAEQRHWRAAVEHALARTSGPVALAAVTTGLGFATLGVFQILSVREFGLLAGGGVLIGGLLALTWVPAVLLLSARRAPEERQAGRRWFLRGTEAVVALSARASLERPRWIGWGFAALVGISLAGASMVRVGSNPPEFFPSGHPVRTGFESLIEHFGADGFLFLQIEAPEGSDILEPGFLNRVEALQADARRVPGVGFASSVADTVLARMHRKMNGDDPEQERLPGSRELAAQYLEVYRWDAADTLAEMVENADRPGYLVVDVFADVNDSAHIVGLIEALRASIAHHFPTPAEGRVLFGGDSTNWSAQNRYIVRGKIGSLFAAIGLVGLVCWLVLRELRTALLAIVPTSFGALAVFGAMGPTGIRLDLASCVITSLVVGIGVDFALHYLFRLRELSEQQGDARAALSAGAVVLAGPPIVYDAVSNVIAFAVFLASPLVPIRHFGWLICLSMVACTAATLLLLPRWAVSPAVRKRTAEMRALDGVVESAR